MATSKSTAEDGQSRQDLLATIRSTTALIQTFLQNLKTGTASPTSTSLARDAPDPLSVLHTSATLLKAHVTKLSLLIINKPFTPTAIRKVIGEISGTCVPAMMSAVEICQPEKYGKLLHEEVRAILRTVFREMGQILEKLQRYIEDSEANDSVGSRDSLVSTGVLWGACDELIELKKEGFPGLVVKKARIFKETLEDEIKELREWGSNDENDDEEHDDAGDNESLDSVERMFAAPDKIPDDRPDLRETLESSLTRLKLIKSVYDSIIKHRLKTMRDLLGPVDGSAADSNTTATVCSPAAIKRVDLTMEVLRHIPDGVGELAEALYEHEDDEAKEALVKVCAEAKGAVEIMKVGWANEVDEFSKFADVWLKLID